MSLSIPTGGVETTPSGETTVIGGTAASGGTYENSGTVIVTMMKSDLSPVDEYTGELVEGCEVSVPMYNFSGNTGSPAGSVSIPTIGLEFNVEIDSSPDQKNKRYYKTEREVDTSKDTVEVEMERAENIGNSV